MRLRTIIFLSKNNVQMKRSFIVLLAMFFVSVWSFAEEGAISGTILDGETSESLIGANIVIEGTATGASTDLDGKYQFEVPEGIYTIVVTYIGYADKKIQGVEVKEHQVTILDIAMGGDAVDLELEVVVQAKAIERSENAVLMLQKKSDKILDGISSQEMSRYSLSNVASAMKKISGATVSEGKYIYIRGLGDRYSSAQLNGLPLPSTNPYRNTPQLDLIPTNLLDNIITSKSFSPDLPGNFTGGNVNIQTKSLPEQFFLTISTKVGYNKQNNLADNFLSYGGGRTDYWGYDDGSRALPQILTQERYLSQLNKEGAFRSRRDAEIAGIVDEAINVMDLDFNPVPQRTPVDHSVTISAGDQWKLGSMPLGYILSGSFKKSYKHLDKYLVRNWDLFDINAGNLRNKGDYEETKSTEIGDVNVMAGLTLKINGLNSIQFTSLYNHSGSKNTRYLYGERPEQIIDEERLQGRGLAFEERQLINYQLGGQHVFSGLNETKIEWKGGYTTSSLEEPNTRYFSNVYNTEEDFYYIPLASVQLPAFYIRNLDDDQYDFKMDLELPIGTNRMTKVKVGGLYSSKERVFSEKLFQITTSNSAEDYAGNPDEFFAKDNVGIIGANENNTSFTIGNYLTDFTSPSNAYSGSNTVSAGYGMLSTQLMRRLKMIVGARYEKTDIEVVSGDHNRSLEERTGSIREGDILPVANMIFSANENTNIRAAYSRTLARPNMREMAPFVSFDPLTASFIIGNPDLTRTTIDNYDLRWEWFTNPGEILAVSAYYKSFTDPISSRYLPSSNTEIKFINVESAQVYGVELEFRKSLGFMGPAFDKLRFSSNFSLIESDVDVVKTSPYEVDKRPFEGQAPFIVNTALLYSDLDQGLDATLSLNWLGDRLRFLGQDGAPDIYDRSRAQLDLNVQKSLGGLGLSLTLQNLLNSDFILSSEYQGVEYLYSRFKTGTSVTMGLSYTFR